MSGDWPFADDWLPEQGRFETAVSREVSCRRASVRDTLPHRVFRSRYSIIADQTGHAGDEDRAQQPSTDYLEPAIIEHKRAGKSEAVAQHGVILIDTGGSFHYLKCGAKIWQEKS